MADFSIDDDFVFDRQFGQELCDVFAQATGYDCVFVEAGGRVVASSLRQRIGSFHEAGGRIMAGDYAERAVTAEEAEASGGLMKEGVSVVIEFDGRRLISFGVAGPLAAVTPVARIGGFCVRAVLHARELERKMVARLALEAVSQSERLLEDMRRQAATDVLTGAVNRAHIEETAQREMQRLGRYGHPVAMIFADLDHFKAVNDRFGHAVGDRVLVEFCDTVRRCARSVDILGRWGGEEFMIITPDSGLAAARQLAERIRLLLHCHDFLPAEHVTASFGVAECLPGENFDSWFARADAALYQAKLQGRDRVETAAEI